MCNLSCENKWITCGDLKAIQNAAIRAIFKIRYDTPSKELYKIAQLPSVEERMSDLNEAYALTAILNKNPLFEEMKEEYEYLNDHYLKDFKTFLCGVKKLS
ncbi:hypothetical protein BpHYR1_005463 [Brachionus plicatilis]|uniref:Uncharacterized protein n=1 Tax=Brachionus plicatilis TaxID=10195 RepID=A0A3M7S3B4_BRAPC|nr:hypothetical protein BpHYR1_005463 [Brachionus plicatilis]